MGSKGTYRRKYYLHRQVKKAGFGLVLEHKHKTITIQEDQAQLAQQNKYVAELQNAFSYGVQFLNPMMQ